MKPAWNAWLQKRYKTPQELAKAWGPSGTTRTRECARAIPDQRARKPGDIGFSKLSRGIGGRVDTAAGSRNQIRRSPCVSDGRRNPVVSPISPADRSAGLTRDFARIGRPSTWTFWKCTFTHWRTELYEYRNREEEVCESRRTWRALFAKPLARANPSSWPNSVGPAAANSTTITARILSPRKTSRPNTAGRPSRPAKGLSAAG